MKTESKEVVQNLINELRLNPAVGAIPQDIANNIQPTFDVKPEPYSFVIRNVESASTGTFTVYTTDTDTSTIFYLTGAYLSISKNATSDAVEVKMSVPPFGDSSVRDLLKIEGTTIVQQQDSITMSFPYPIPIARGSNITISSSFTVGAQRFSGTVMGFYKAVTTQRVV